MSGPKTEFNNQWGNTADDGGDLVPASQTPASGNNRGKAPLTDLFGRIWVRLAASSGSMGNVVSIPGALSAADSLKRSTGDANPRVIVAGPAKWYAVHVLADEKAWIQLFDLVAAPAVGAVPVYSWFVEKERNLQSAAVSNLNPMGDFFGTGLTIAASSTPNKFDGVIAGTAADYIVTVLYDS